MLTGIFGKKSDHPLADIRSAQQWLGDLPKNDVHKLLMDLAEMMESVLDNPGFKLDHQFAVVRLLDEAAQPYTRKLTAEYFVPHELSSFQEGRLWLVLGNYFRQTAIAYNTIFNRYCSAEKGSTTIKAQVPLLMSRAVHAMISQMKYVCAHYDLVEYAIWENLARILSYAEQQQYLDIPVSLYSSMPGNTSVRSEVGHLLGWYSCGVSSLSPVHMHLTERILARYCVDIEIQVRQSESSIYSFDLSNPDVPRRAKINAVMTPATRFVSMLAMHPKLEQLLKTLEKNIVPTELVLGGNYGAELVKEAVRHLLSYLVDPPVRRSARRVLKIRFNVANSFGEVLSCVNTSDGFDQNRTLWTIADISANGFLTALPIPGNPAMRIGSVLGMQLEGMAHWGVTAVRRLRNDGGQLQVGAEILATQVASVALRQSGGGGGFEDGQLALWLYTKPGDPPGETKLLMKAGTFSANRSLQTQLNGKNYLLIPSGLQEKYIDCDMARFRLIEQEDEDEED